jgi:RNA polymerase sigma-70 factor (ECF subfamily)
VRNQGLDEAEPMKKAMSILSLFTPRTDEESMLRVKTCDDHLQFSRIVERWEEPIRRLCTRMTGDPHRGEDLKQDTFVRVFERRKEYQATGRFSTFLWRIALNLCYDELRRHQRRQDFLQQPLTSNSEGELLEPIAEVPGPDVRTAQLEEGELVRQAVMQLPEIYRTVVVLRHYQDLRLGQIAEILEIPEGTVNSRLAEALNRLSRCLTPKFERSGDTTARPRLTVIPKASVNL